MKKITISPDNKKAIEFFERLSELSRQQRKKMMERLDKALAEGKFKDFKPEKIDPNEK